MLNVNVPRADRLGGRRILLVEDHEYLADALGWILEENGAVVVGKPSCVRDALPFCEDEDLDGAFLDVKLRTETSFCLADILRRRGIPFAFVTGSTEAEGVPQRFDNVTRVPKPFGEDEIAEVAARLFGKHDVFVPAELQQMTSALQPRL